eukprot:m.67656 g.67656  ORF g.67656 m.67656 type:complete len:155 (+) comp35464_c0_seq2:88-552(+)
MGNNVSKQFGALIGGAVATVCVAAGIGLMRSNDSTVAVTGGVAIAAGISAVVNTVEQCATSEKFNTGQLMRRVGIGALGGSVSAAASEFLSSTAGEVGSIMMGQTIGGAVTEIASKLVNGEKVGIKDVGKGALGGAFLGFVRAGTKGGGSEGAS